MVALEDSDPLFPEFLSDCPAFGRVSFDAEELGRKQWMPDIL